MPENSRKSSQGFDWESARHDILSRIDLRAEAESFGVVFTASEPGASGWLPCHAVGREDKSPSAAVCVSSSNGSLGLYKDSAAEGHAISFFELAAKAGRFGDWKAARDHYAKQAGVELPEGVDLDAQVRWRPWNRNTCRLWCEHHKAGLTLEQVEAFGAALCQWPARLPEPYTCLAIPSYRDGDHPTGWVLFRTDGDSFAGTEKLSVRKVHNLKGSGEGWVNAGGPKARASATTVWRVEGPTDAIALQAILPPGHLAVSNITGAGADPNRLPLEWMAGKSVRVIGDADKPGESGARRHATAFARVAADVRIVKLPYPIEDKHGKDVRDWVAGGGTFEGLLELEAAGEAVAAKVIPEDIANYEAVPDGEKVIRETIPLPLIAEKIRKSRDNWPKSIGGILYVPGRPTGRVPDTGAVHPVRSVNDLFAWLRDGGASIRWAGSCKDATPATKEELYSFLSHRGEEQYQSIGYLPHYPPILGTYYLPVSLPESDGSALAEFLDHLNPETPMDKRLMLAAMLTPGWGGPPGQRPAFVFTSEHGRGSGKTKTAEGIAEIWGGFISTSTAKKTSEDFRSRLLDDSALTMRTVIIDNVKGVVSNAEVESMITAKVIDGKRMYHGDYRRANHLTWFITANSPTLSKDLADRSVVIKVGRPQSSDWEAWLIDFLARRRLSLLADLMAILQSEDQGKIDAPNLDRWNAWQRAVLQKIPGANEIAAHIKGVRPTVDVDSEDGEEVADALRKLIASVRHDGRALDPDAVQIGIPVRDVYELLRGVWNEPHMRDREVRFRLSEILTTASLANFRPCKHRTWGRCFLWRGENSKGEETQIFPWSQEWIMKSPTERSFEIRSKSGSIF